MKKHKKVKIIMFTIVFMQIMSLRIPAAEIGETEDNKNEMNIDEIITEYNDFNLKEIEEILKTHENNSSYSFAEIMKMIASGRLTDVLQIAGEEIKSELLGEAGENGRLVMQILTLAIIGAVFTNFSHVFSESQISETAFFVTYMLLFTFLAASFFSSMEIASTVLKETTDFMRTLMPSYFMAVAFAGGSASALVLYEATLLIITVIQSIFLMILLPLTKTYILLVLADHIVKECILSKMTDLIKNIIDWTAKTTIGVVMGLHIIQGMVLPCVDAVKNSGFQKFLEIIPGIGKGAGAAAHLVLGSGVLIKNTMGAAAVVVLAVITLVPVIKLVVIMLMYECIAAFLQPICDKRIVSCISDVAKGHRMLLQIVLITAVLFGASIAVICSTTNVSYLAG